MIEKKLQLNAKIPEPFLKAALKIESTLKNAGFKAYLVGGSIRNVLLNLPVKDIDYTTDAHPQEVMKLFKKVVPVGIEFGTVIVLIDGIASEITTFRSDNDYADGRHPSQVKFSQTLKEDVIRRDFTINGLAYSVSEEILIDHIGGLADLEARLLRTIGPPHDRFGEDGLRSVRVCRFAAMLQFQITEDTKTAMQETLQVTRKVAKERFFDEWRKTLKSQYRSEFWSLLVSMGLAQLFIKTDFLRGLGKVQRQTLLSEGRPINMAMYALYLFWHIKEQINESDLNQLKFPKKAARLTIELKHSALLNAYLSETMNRFEIKKSLSTIERKSLRFHIRLIKDYDLVFVKKRERFKELILTIRGVITKQEPIYLNQLAINGDDLVKLGYKGKSIKEALIRAQEIVWQKPSLNNKEKLIQLLG